MDLLNLARTTKDLRLFLMKSSSSQFWKAARLNVDALPPCPDDLSEPAYANLLFDSHCHVGLVFLVHLTDDRLAHFPSSELSYEELPNNSMGMQSAPLQKMFERHVRFRAFGFTDEYALRRHLQVCRTSTVFRRTAGSSQECSRERCLCQP